MSYKVFFKNNPAGYSLTAAQKGDPISIIQRDFTSTEDGLLFINRLEGIPSDILSLLPEAIQPSTIDHLLAIVERSGNATVFINELHPTLKTRLKTSINEVGKAVYVDDIADIISVDFRDVNIPPDTGIVFLFSIGWRKGFFFDFVPLGDHNYRRDYDIGSQLGRFYTYLTFQEYFQVGEDEYKQFFFQQWFPFISLRRDTVKKMISGVKQGWSIDEILLDKICADVTEMSEAMRTRWKGNKYIQAHIDLLDHGLNKFLEGDYISSTSILFPRIEGVIRTAYLDLVGIKGISQASLSDLVLKSRDDIELNFSLLLPKAFSKFLKDVYFASFDPGKPAPLSRNTISHGVAEVDKFSLKSSLMALLIVDQLFFLLPP